MQQLITIETVPISIKYVEKESSPSADEMAKSQAPNKSDAAVKPIPARIKTDSFMHSSPADTYNLSYTATAHYSDNGNLRLNVEMTDAEESSYVFRQFGRDMGNMISRIFEVDRNSSGDFEGMHLNFDLSQLQNTVPGSGKTGNTFTPPTFELEILERPKVIIKYVGGPIYIPRSADPDYEAPPEAMDTKV